jgi:hypothetical protein
LPCYGKHGEHFSFAREPQCQALSGEGAGGTVQSTAEAGLLRFLFLEIYGAGASVCRRLSGTHRSAIFTSIPAVCRKIWWACTPTGSSLFSPD